MRRKNSVEQALNSGVAELDLGDNLTAKVPLGNPPAITVDTSVGTRVFVGDTMIHGDTGVRDVTERITPEPTAGWLRIRRVGNLVEIRSNSLSIPTSGTTIIGNIPSGFRPIGIVYFKAVPYWGSETSETARIVAGGDFTVLSMSPENAMNFQIMYYTSNPWPASLPGTPA